MKEIEKTYDPKKYENAIYKEWEASGYFNPDELLGKRRKPYTIIMPPPNANGSLHAGHAVFVTIQDLLIRFRRMQGFRTVWIPGADHAGFETQVVYEKKLEEEGRSRLTMRPEDLRKEILEFTLNNKSYMEGQLRKLGASCDWSRNTFTLDKEIIDIVYKTFKKLGDDKLLYRGKRSVNWCTKHLTSLSDLEQETSEKKDTLFYIKYGPFVVATVRPETIFGDVAIAVHPDDKRYKKNIGKTVLVTTPIGTIDLKVVADDSVDKEFGTGALKITPAHDANDFEVAKRHNLNTIEVIDEHGILNEKTGKYKGLTVEDARKKVAKDLNDMGLMKKEEGYTHAVPLCYKCKSTLEPRILPQWFIRIKPLAKKALHAVKKKKVVIVTKKYEKTFFHWMESINDWNISRQIIWGIPIPAKICDACDEGQVDIEDVITKCKKCGGGLRKDTDTFDTWFSSGQWPFATLKFPKHKDYKTFYPTDVMETAADILFFWVARMIMLSIYCTGKIPFKYVYLHGLVRDAKGQKMSKSKGNVINPMVLSDKYGTDALRLGLSIGNSPGNNMNLSEDKISAYGKFANKLWNISRYILLSTENKKSTSQNPTPTTLADQWILSRMHETIQAVTDDLENFRFSLAGEKLVSFTWDDFADWYIEVAKVEGDKNEILMYVLTTTLKLWHPFAPFVTEAIWGTMKDDNTDLLMVQEWPQVKKRTKAPKEWHLLQECIKRIRHLKSIYRISPNTLVPTVLSSEKNETFFKAHRDIIVKLGRVTLVKIVKEAIVRPKTSIHFSLVNEKTELTDVYLDVEGIIDLDAEKKRIQKEIKRMEQYSQTLLKKLENESFIKKAPKKIIDEERAKYRETEEKIKKYRQQ